MELLSQHGKRIMEGCKQRARDAGLQFNDESLEYIVSNRDLVELGPKNMIPTLYDYWVQDVEVLKEQGKYELYPNNPYETVINTRPPISFYNDNNPDWLNVMIFYHVIGHIDFFQNNLYFRHTWEYDFASKALSDKRLIAKLRSEKGRWVDYIIEFSLAIDNLVGYFDVLSQYNQDKPDARQSMLDYYFDVFLQRDQHFKVTEYVKEISRFNKYMKRSPEKGLQRFVDSVKSRHAEFESVYEKAVKNKKHPEKLDLLQYLMTHSSFLNQEENRWMKTVMEVIRSTSLYFQPQIRTKILNEGWASYWHEVLFLQDDRISGHEVDFSIVNAKVTSMPRVGLNPYALGMRLFNYLEEQAEAGRISFDFRKLKSKQKRKDFDAATGRGKEFIFSVRENFSDATFVRSFIDQDFVDQHKLFVAGKRFNKERMTWQYYVQSRKAEDYKKMVSDSLYHPPSITIREGKDNRLILDHQFESKPLVRDFIGGTMRGLEYLWGGPVELFTTEPLQAPKSATDVAVGSPTAPGKIHWQRYKYTMNRRELTRKQVANA